MLVHNTNVYVGGVCLTFTNSIKSSFSKIIMGNQPFCAPLLPLVSNKQLGRQHNTLTSFQFVVVVVVFRVFMRRRPWLIDFVTPITFLSASHTHSYRFRRAVHEYWCISCYNVVPWTVLRTCNVSIKLVIRTLCPQKCCQTFKKVNFEYISFCSQILLTLILHENAQYFEPQTSCER